MSLALSIGKAYSPFGLPEVMYTLRAIAKGIEAPEAESETSKASQAVAGGRITTGAMVCL